MTFSVRRFSKSIAKRMMKRVAVDQETAATDSSSQAASYPLIKLSSLTPSFLTTKYSNLSSATLIRQIFVNSWCSRLQKWRSKKGSRTLVKSFWFSWSMCQTRSFTTSRRQNNRLSPWSTQRYPTSWEIPWVPSWEKWIPCRATFSALERSFIT